MFSYKRWRHSKGFGIHSPFAYNLICEVVNPNKKYALYGYNIIEANRNHHGQTTISEARFLLRLLVFLKSKRIILPEDAPGIFRVAAEAADSRIPIDSDAESLSESALICVTGNGFSLDSLSQTLQKEGVTLLVKNISPETRNKLWDSLPQGLMLYGRKNVILINRPGMMKVAYSITI